MTPETGLPVAAVRILAYLQADGGEVSRRTLRAEMALADTSVGSALWVLGKAGLVRGVGRGWWRATAPETAA